MTFRECRDMYGISFLPDGLERYYDGSTNTSPLIDRRWLDSVFEKYSVGRSARADFMCALELAETDDGLCSFTHFIVEQTCAQRNRLDGEHINITSCAFLHDYGEYDPMIILLACVLPASESLRRRDVPESFYSDIPYRVIGGMMRGLDRGEMTLSFPWNANFCTCSIFSFGRFYLIPHRFSADFDVMRRGDGQTAAVMHGGTCIRLPDGQYDGVCGVHGNKTFDTVYELRDGSLTANPISPVGFVSEKTFMFDTREWRNVLHDGDCMLALHIPGGPGYTPDGVRECAERGLEFYRRYFPELDIKGLWSESWLYDPHLRLVLPRTSGIITVQDSLYCVPFGGAHASIHSELRARNGRKTSLEISAERYEERGGTFNSCCMFVLAQDIPHIGENRYLYGTKGERTRFELANMP